MNIFFSPSTGGFYLADLHGQAIPTDAVEISRDEHRALLDGQSAGMRIVAGEDGNPSLQEPEPEVMTLEEFRRKRTRALALSDWTQRDLGDVEISAEDKAAWAAWRQLLRNWPETGGDIPPAPPQPKMIPKAVVA
jgi:hypothetical protein